MSARPGWDEYFMEIAHTVATRATCPRASVGAVLVREHRILTTGYNGAPRGVAHCTEAGCIVVNDHCQRATHAEANAIVQGALHGVGLQGATAYCTHQPCVNCSKLLISAGVVKIVYDQPYPDPVAERTARRGRRRARSLCIPRGRTLVTAALIYFVTFAIAATVAACATPLVIRLATHLQIIDATHEDRRVHDVPTPRIGGLAVFFGFAFALFAVLGFALSSPVCALPVDRALGPPSKGQRHRGSVRQRASPGRPALRRDA